MAGLLCARVLADSFVKVTIIEREARPERPNPRKCVPQGHHAHALFEITVRTLRDWFPGMVEAMVEAGALLVDPCRTFAVYHYGGWKPRFNSDLETLLCTRPFVEWFVRSEIEKLANVEIRDEHTVEGLLYSPERECVTGVRVRTIGPVAGDEQRLAADLVVDAAGRGTRAPRWLSELGFDRPEEDTVEIDLCYTSRLFELPDDPDRDFRWITVNARYPGTRGAYLVAVEHNRWLLSLFGYLGDHPPTDDAGFLEFARSLPTPAVYNTLERATFVTPAVAFKIPSSRWYHYEKLRRLPEGLVALGDSVCSLNPVYGQGITVTMQCVRELGQQLDEQTRAHGHLRGFPKRFYAKQAALLAMPWTLSTTLDLRFPQAKGKRALGIGALQWTFMNLFDLTSIDADAARIFYEVLHMRRGPEGLRHPKLLWPLLASCAKSRFDPLEARLNTGPMPRAPQA